MNRVRAGKLIFRDPVLLCGMVYLLLYFDASGFLRLGLLAAVVADSGGWFTTDVFPAALLTNPADAFRLYNLSASQATAAAAGLAGAANAIPPLAALTSVLVWPLCGLGAAVLAFRRITP